MKRICAAGGLGLALTLFGCSDGSHPSEADVAVARHEPFLRNAPKIVLESTVYIDFGPNLCTGVWVAPQKILTAKHCFRGDFDARRLTVHFGPVVARPRAKLSGVGRARVHPTTDLAVFTIKELVPSEFVVAQLDHPGIPNLTVEDEVVIAGYGKSAADRQDLGKHLRWGKTVFRAVKDWWTFNNNARYNGMLLLNSPASARASTCSGDSGGPVFREVDGLWVLTGIMSGGPDDCATDSQTVAVNILPFRNWVLR